jgi:hypothetical protein
LNKNLHLLFELLQFPPSALLGFWATPSDVWTFAEVVEAHPEHKAAANLDESVRVIGIDRLVHLNWCAKVSCRSKAILRYRFSDLIDERMLN